ncbi:hypothetical protein GCM10010289_80590 [Streptomyces violascens]|uniref:Uncharacterized protein n=1 Tax=Streptomyces violascens TaxID=67381 RepID=A0ABQ3QS92_9ACTN|nr:hypothetical protein GCM10010289_80590 [Streptomyces violascens]GHI40160.1 hypothetical protein Sviol_45680 [Streptomyces violascens]
MVITKQTRGGQSLDEYRIIVRDAQLVPIDLIDDHLSLEMALKFKGILRTGQGPGAATRASVPGWGSSSPRQGQGVKSDTYVTSASAEGGAPSRGLQDRRSTGGT